MQKYIIAAAALMIFSGNVNADDGLNHHTSQTFLKYCQEVNAISNNSNTMPSFTAGMCIGFITAIEQSNVLLETVDGMPHFCLSKGITYGQRAAIWVKYLNNNPEMWSEAAMLTYIKAMNNSFPCKD